MPTKTTVDVPIFVLNFKGTSTRSDNGKYKTKIQPNKAPEHAGFPEWTYNMHPGMDRELLAETLRKIVHELEA